MQLRDTALFEAQKTTVRPGEEKGEESVSRDRVATKDPYPPPPEAGRARCPAMAQISKKRGVITWYPIMQHSAASTPHLPTSYFVATPSVPTPRTTRYHALKLRIGPITAGVPHLGLPLTNGDLVHATGPHQSPLSPSFLFPQPPTEGSKLRGEHLQVVRGEDSSVD